MVEGGGRALNFTRSKPARPGQTRSNPDNNRVWSACRPGSNRVRREGIAKHQTPGLAKRLRRGKPKTGLRQEACAVAENRWRDKSAWQARLPPSLRSYGEASQRSSSVRASKRQGTANPAPRTKREVATGGSPDAELGSGLLRSKPACAWSRAPMR